MVANIPPWILARTARSISWVKAALKDFRRFPKPARTVILDALALAAAGGKAEVAKPMHGLGVGVFEIALPHRGDAYRTVYALQLGRDIWVVHAFQKKASKGRATPKKEIDLIRRRIQLLKESMR